MTANLKNEVSIPKIWFHLTLIYWKITLRLEWDGGVGK